MLGNALAAAAGAVSPALVERRLAGWLSRYGLQAVFGLQVLGIVGLPVPDELLLTIAGTLVRAGKLPLAGTLAAAMCGAATGITISYLAGRFIGLAALRRFVHIPDEVLHRVEHWFRRSGGWLLTVGYFIPGVRHVTAIAAGSSGLGYVPFAAYAYPGAILWSSLFVTAGYVLGDQWRPAFESISRNVRLVIVVAGLAYLVYLAFVLARWYRRRASRPPME
jgi:membrane protein DedA with SNARE-associated domain